MSKKFYTHTGFTFAEMLVATGLFAVAMGMILNIYISGLKTWETTSEQADLQARARLTMNTMVRELRSATRTSAQNPSPNLVIPAAPNNTRITFYVPEDTNGDGLITDANGAIEWNTGDPIQYQYGAAQKILTRLQNGVQRVICRDVFSVRFIDIGIDPTLSIFELKINLTLSKTTQRQRSISVTLSSIVRLRN